MQRSSGGAGEQWWWSEAVWLQRSSVVAEKQGGCAQWLQRSGGIRNRDADVITLSRSGMNCPFVENC